MSTRSIRTSSTEAACDVCGRTLLRGEHAEIYLSGESRRSVCELCTSRALHGGWVREGDMPEYDERRRPDRRRSLFGRLRNRRDTRDIPQEDEGEFAEPLALEPADDEHDLVDARAAGAAQPDPWAYEEPAPAEEPPPSPSPSPSPSPRATRPVPAPRRPFGRRSSPKGAGAPAGRRAAAVARGAGREPRHVRAVPTSAEQRIASAIVLFNDSEHPRTVAGIGRSLGLPDVSVRPVQGSAVVNIVVSWELCWYRYEVDLAEEVPSVRVGAQGYELDELSEIARRGNASADDRGRLSLGA